MQKYRNFEKISLINFFIPLFKFPNSPDILNKNTPTSPSTVGLRDYVLLPRRGRNTLTGGAARERVVHQPDLYSPVPFIGELITACGGFGPALVS